MRRVVVVDDDKEFLTSIRVVLKARGYEVSVFAAPVEALKTISILKPEIIVTDIMMPGIHGLDFLTIAHSIMGSAAIVVISANTVEQVERDFGSGTLAGLSFFQKPLSLAFFTHLETLSAEQTVKVDPSLNLGERAPLPTEGPAALITVAQIEKLQKVYAKVQSLIWEMALKKWDCTASEFAAWKDADQNLATILDVLAQSEDDRQKIMLNLERSCGSWEKQVRQNLNLFLPAPASVRFEDPFVLDEAAVDPRCHGLGPIHSMAFQVDAEFKPSLTINDQLIDLRYDLFDSNEGRLVNGSRLFQHMMHLARDSSRQHRRAFWRPELYFEGTSATELSIEFPRPLLTSFGSVTTVQTGISVLRVTLQDGSCIVDLKAQLLHEPLPTECLFKGKVTVRVTIDPVLLVVAGFLDGEPLHVPFDELEKAARQRGLTPDGTKYCRSAWAFHYLWAVAIEGLRREEKAPGFALAR